MKNAVKTTAILFMSAIALALAGCETESDYAEETTVQTEADTEAETEQKIYDVLNSTPVHQNFRPTIGNMITAVFYDYEITWQSIGIADNVYTVKVSGNYCPNPDFPNLSMYGKIYYYVNLENGSCSVTTDENNITSVFLAYILE